MEPIYGKPFLTSIQVGMMTGALDSSSKCGHTHPVAEASNLAHQRSVRFFRTFLVEGHSGLEQELWSVGLGRVTRLTRLLGIPKDHESSVTQLLVRKSRSKTVLERRGKTGTLWGHLTLVVLILTLHRSKGSENQTYIRNPPFYLWTSFFFILNT